MENRKFYIETYGCKVNQYESQAIREAWQNAGYAECDRPEDASCIIINSCAITSHAERDARNAVYRLRRLAPAAKILLCGCAAQFFPQFRPRKKAAFSRPDQCISQRDKIQLLQGPDIAGLPPRQWQINHYWRSRPVVKIQDGCSQNCAYCIVPQTRGKPRSREPEDILAECRRLLADGHGELIISGINLRQYGIKGFGDFWDLLSFLDKALAPEFKNAARLRISSLEPGQLGQRGLDILASANMLCPHLHLSLQHASDGMLRQMGRGHYTAQGILAMLGQLRGHWPRMGLGADIIAGFPGESEEDVEELLAFVREAGLTYAHVFPFSARQGTRAASLPGQHCQKVKQERAGRVRQVIATLRQNFMEQLCRQTKMAVAFDAQRGGTDSRAGVNEYYCQCILAEPAGQDLQGLVEVESVGMADGFLRVRLPGRKFSGQPAIND